MSRHPDYPINHHRTYSLLHKPEQPHRPAVKEHFEQNLVCPLIKDFKLVSSQKKECVYKEGTRTYKFRQV